MPKNDVIRKITWTLKFKPGFSAHHTVLSAADLLRLSVYVPQFFHGALQLSCFIPFSLIHGPLTVLKVSCSPDSAAPAQRRLRSLHYRASHFVLIVHRHITRRVLLRCLCCIAPIPLMSSRAAGASAVLYRAHRLPALFFGTNLSALSMRSRYMASAPYVLPLWGHYHTPPLPPFHTMLTRTVPSTNILCPADLAQHPLTRALPSHRSTYPSLYPP